MTAIQKVLKFCDDALLGFRRDPANSDFERGYQAAVEKMQNVAIAAQENEEAFANLRRGERGNDP